MRWIRFTAEFIGVESETRRVPSLSEGSRFRRVQVMNFVALRMLTGDRAKYLGLIFAIAFCTFLLENQTSIFASILKRTGSQILDVTDADLWVMDGKTEYFERTKALKDTDLTRVRGVSGVEWAVKLFKGYPVARTRAGKFAACILLGLDDAILEEELRPVSSIL
jgi:putative ABC transport system permease protein